MPATTKGTEQSGSGCRRPSGAHTPSSGTRPSQCGNQGGPSVYTAGAAPLHPLVYTEGCGHRLQCRLLSQSSRSSGLSQQVQSGGVRKKVPQRSGVSRRITAQGPRGMAETLVLSPVCARIVQPLGISWSARPHPSQWTAQPLKPPIRDGKDFQEGYSITAANSTSGCNDPLRRAGHFPQMCPRSSAPASCRRPPSTLGFRRPGAWPQAASDPVSIPDRRRQLSHEWTHWAWAPPCLACFIRSISQIPPRCCEGPGFTPISRGGLV